MLVSIPLTNPPPWELLLQASQPATRSSSLDTLIKLFYHVNSEVDQPVEPLFSQMHNYNPPEHLTAEQWIEFMLRSRWTYANFCFRRRNDPDGLYFPTYTITDFSSNQPKRACAKTPINVAYPHNPSKHISVKLKTQKKKREHYQSVDSFSISQLHDINSFKFAYQPQLQTSTISSFPGSIQSTQASYHEPQSTPSHSPVILSGSPTYETPSYSKSSYQPRSQKQSNKSPQWPYEQTNDNLRSLFFNLDGSDLTTIYDIIDVMEKQFVDLVCIVDPRLDDRFKSLQSEIRSRGLQIRLFYVPQAPSKRKDGRVGGILFLTGSRLSKLKLERVCPEGSFSILHGFFGLTPVHFLGTYWPVFNVDPQSLWQRMQRRYQMHPIEAIQAKIGSKLLTIHLSQQAGFLFGDFNSDVTSTSKKDKYNLAAFCQANRLFHSSTTTQLQSPSYGKSSLNSSGQSRIDYQFHNGFNIDSNRVSCFPADILHHIGSHRCLLASYYLADSVPQSGRYKNINHNCNIDISNTVKIAKLKAGLDDLFNEVEHMTNPKEAITEVTIGSVRVARMAFPQKTRRRFNHFSPHAAALRINLNFLRRISNGIHGSKAHLPWNHRAYKRAMKSILVQWKKQLTKVLCRSTNAEVSLHEILTSHADCYGFLYWGSKSLNETRYIIGTAYSETKKRLHARRRRDMRKTFATKAKHMEEQRTVGKLKNIIAYVMGPKRKPYNFDELIVEGEPITCPKEIHDTITLHFEDWFKSNPNTGQASNDPNAYSDLKLPWPDFKKRFIGTNISEPLLQSLHRALNSGPSESKQNIMASTLRATPTLSEFKAAISHTKNGTAPGLSGLTYSIIKLWPDTLVDFVFQQLLALWSTHSFPTHWSDKWIAPIPKTADPTLESLRPIALLEVLRKLWVAIIIHRIQTLFRTGGYLHPSQHGCLRGVGTDEAILEITNILEATKERQGEVYVASWDMRRAFDRVPKSFLVFAWLRMGVPLEIAQYLVELDIGGTTIVKTPFAQGQLKKQGISSKEALGFTAETGCAQGDPQSAISWNTFIDILLVALHDKNPNNAHFLNHHGLQVPQYQSAYVDDILSILYTSDDLQREANIVSAFTILSSMEISIPKLKAFRFNWGNPNTPGIQNFIVHTAGWKPNIVPLAHTGSFKYLGLWIDNELTHQKQFEVSKQQLLLLCDQIICSKISPESKLRLITASLFLKLLYATKFTSWFLAQYQSLDRILDRTYRIIAKCLPSTPSLLLHMKAEDGGLELPKLSTTVNERKLKLLQRLDQQTPYRKSVVLSLLGRGARSQGHILPVGHGTTLTAPLYPWWITSLTQELTLNGMSLTIHGPGSNNYLSPPIYQWNTQLTQQLHAASVQQGEPGVSLFKETSNSIENIPLRVGQVWAACINESFQSLQEIVGFADDYTSILCQSWDYSNNQLTPGSVALRNSNAQDTTNIIKHTYDTLFPIGQVSYLVILSNAIYVEDKLRKIIVSRHQHLPMRISSYVPSDTIINVLHDLGKDVSTIYTDGGWKRIPSLVDPLSHSTKSGGAIVLQYENGSYGCIQLATDLPTNSVYPIELLALAAARIIAKGSRLNPEIHTDSQAALNTMVSISNGRIQNQYLQYTISHENLYAPLHAFHVKSHVEQRQKNTALWSKHEIGNYIADNLTLHDWSRQQEARIQVGPTFLSISRVAGLRLSALIQAFAQRNSFAITSLGLPFMHSLKAQSQSKLKDDYIYQRDSYRAQRGDRVKWAKRDLRTLKYTYPTVKSLTDKALRMKIIFNKHWTGANQYKYSKHSSQEDNSQNFQGVCQLCKNGEETQQHIIHLCSHRDMESCRVDVCTNINTQVRELKKQYPNYGNILDTLRDVAYTTSNTYLWTGLWPKAIVRRIITAIRRLNLNIDFIILLKLSRVFTQETKRLYQTRANVLDTSRRSRLISTLPKPSPSILNCFPRRSKPKATIRHPKEIATNTSSTKKVVKSTEVLMKKITQYGFVPKMKVRNPLPKPPSILHPYHPDRLPHSTLNEILTEFRQRDVPFSFPNPKRQRTLPEPQAPQSLPDILTQFRQKLTPFSFSDPKPDLKKRKWSTDGNLECLTHTDTDLLPKPKFTRITPTTPPREEETTQPTGSSTRQGIG